MQLRDIFSCVTLDDAIAKARAAREGASQRNCRGTRARVSFASRDRDYSFIHCCVPILLSGCASLALSGCLGGQIIGANANASAGSLQATPINVSFGSVPLGTTTNASVSLVNQGSAAVKVSQVSLAGQWFTVSGAGDLPITVPAGHTINLSVSFSPAAMGTATGELTIASDAAANGTLVVGLSGSGTAAATPNPPTLSSFSCVDAVATGPASDICTVGLSTAATSGGFTVSLTSNNAAVSLPASVTVAEGSTAMSFTANVSAVSTTETATLTASAGGVAKTFAIQVNAASQVGTSAPELSGLSCGSSSMTGAGTDACAVTLNAPAPSGGFAVSLATNNSAVSVPASVTVAAGAESGSFTATVAAVTAAQTATLTASAGGVAQTFGLQLAVSVPGLSVNATSIAFGNVNLNSPATQSVTLTSTGTAGVTISLATVIGSGFTISGASFPFTLTSNESATISVQFDPTVTGAASGTLTIVSTSLTNPIVTIGLSGTGVAAVAYQVDLSWDPPTSSPDPVAGYNVYRSPSGASAYVQLNSTVVTQTTYLDSNVQDGQTYDYFVESIDAAGVASAPSNTAVVPIP